MQSKNIEDGKKIGVIDRKQSTNIKWGKNNVFTDSFLKYQLILECSLWILFF